MIEMEHFYNGGFGWSCRACEADLKNDSAQDARQTSRLMREGEAESKKPRLSNDALAKWADMERSALICPRCGIRESINLA